MAATSFLAARFGFVFAVAVVVALVADAIPEAGPPSPVVTVIRLLLGIALIVSAIVTWVRHARSDEEPGMPSWMSSIESTTVGGAARLGILLSVANLKELAFGVGAGLTIGGARLGAAADIALALVYTVLACLGVIVAVVAVWVAEDRVSATLENVRGWLVRNNKPVIGAVLLIVGAVLVGEAIWSL
jgi:hypothetical protein